MFLFHYLLAGRSPAFRTKLTAMAEYLHSLLGPSGSLSFFGDDDGGRFFHPYGPRECFGRATLATLQAFSNGRTALQLPRIGPSRLHGGLDPHRI